MNLDLIRDWDAHLAHEKRRSEHTRRAYIATAERFCAFLSQHRGGVVSGPMLAKLTPNDLRAYLAERRADGLGNASAARELAASTWFLRRPADRAPACRSCAAARLIADGCDSASHQGARLAAGRGG